MFWKVTAYIEYLHMKEHIYDHRLRSIAYNFIISVWNHMCKIGHANPLYWGPPDQLDQQWLYPGGKNWWHGTLFMLDVTKRYLWGICRKMEMESFYTIMPTRNLIWLPWNFANRNQTHKPIFIAKNYLQLCISGVCVIYYPCFIYMIVLFTH